MDSPEDIAAIGKIREAAMAAYTGGDADALANLYTENAVSEPNNGPTLNGRSAIAASLKGTFERSSMKVTLVPDQTKTTGSTGFEAGHYTAEVTPKSGAASTTVEGRYMMLLTKGSDGSWKVAYDMDNVGQPSTPATAAATEPAK
jgi:uncharacterized protein (TIGR02246 family)